VDAENTWVVASDATIRPAAIAATRSRLPAALRPLATRVADRIRPPLPGGSVYTDDRAPVEWLVDQSLLRYAAGNE
jgi:hypothetical protein